jgi:hypothetical protein
MIPSIRIALEDLGLERVAIIYPGNKRFSLAKKVEAVSLDELGQGGHLFK